jgi:glycine/sarcosine N-methyltransferase
VVTDQTENNVNGVSGSVAEFYDLLAPDYDAMTGFEKRFVQERPFFRLLVERYNIRTALDAGCGSGFHALLLAELGVNVTAVDTSEKMVQLTREHAKERGASVETAVTGFEELDRVITKKFDAVFVLGNSLPHLLSSEQLDRALTNFAGVLNPGGILFTQTLNYDRILANPERVLNSKDVGEKTFVRYYEYDGTEILFNIMTRTKCGSRMDETVRSVRLRPILQHAFLKQLEDAGFTELKTFGGISMDSFTPGESRDLVILAQKPL